VNIVIALPTDPMYGPRMATLLNLYLPISNIFKIETFWSLVVAQVLDNFWRKGLRVITSDYDDSRIADNIAHNCALNQVPNCHIPHTWGQLFPFHLLHFGTPPLQTQLQQKDKQNTNTNTDNNNFRETEVSNEFSGAASSSQPSERLDVIVASDILLYAEQYGNLISSLHQLFQYSIETQKNSGTTNGNGNQNQKEGEKEKQEEKGEEFMLANGVRYRYPFFLLNVGRRLKTAPVFFEMLGKAGFVAHPLYSTMHVITLPSLCSNLQPHSSSS
jgi:hypothetical protein